MAKAPTIDQHAADIEYIKKEVTIPILHIAEVTADLILEKNIRNIILLGTKYTMEQDFYKKILTYF